MTRDARSPSMPVTSFAYDGIPVRRVGFRAPNVPVLRNYCKNERLTATLSRAIAATVERDAIDVVHAQHVWTTPPSVVAARRTGRPVLCTVRDYWPVCYWSTLIVDDRRAALCPACSTHGMRRCLASRSGIWAPLATGLIPYMQANLARKAAAVAACDRVIAVSTTIARDLVERCPGLAADRLRTIPNPVDVAGLTSESTRGGAPLEGPYTLYVGKLAANKGVAKLFEAIERARMQTPLVVVGDGPSRSEVEARARASGRHVRFTGWVARDEALRWMAHAQWMIFPSQGPESLSRVLLESGALGVPAAAMDTGGTRDIVVPGVTGLLSNDVDGLARDISTLEADPALRERLGRAAAAHVASRFGAAQVVARVLEIYGEALEGRPALEEGRG